MSERVKKYRQFAEECLEMAARAHDEETRAVFVLMAQVWHRLAQEIEELTDELASSKF